MPTIVTVGVYTVIIAYHPQYKLFHFSTFTDKETEASRKVKQLAETQGLSSPYQDACYVKVFIANHPRPFAS